MVFPKGQRALRIRAFLRDSGAHDFRQTIDIQRFQSHAPFEFTTHPFAPRFGTENPKPQTAS